MDPVVGALAQLIAINDRLLGKALDGLTEEEGWRHPGDANPICWIVGHLTVYRNGLAKALGTGEDLPWARFFEMKSQPDQSAGGPSLAEIRAALQGVSERLAARFEQLTDAELSAVAPRRVPIADRTVRGLIAFLAYHESYHVGQVAYLRKWLGYPGIVDGQ
jgi:uncharacterized damage-inducible protein DinB